MNTRQEQIVQIVNERGRVSVKALSQLTGVSEVTVRQDLTLLARDRFLTRIHGLAVALDSDDVNCRMRIRYSIKQALATFAAAQVNDGEAIFIEGGSTNALLARALAPRNDLTIITVSHAIAHLLRDSRCSVIILGGEYQKSSESVVGPLTRHCIAQVHFSKAFIGVDGWQADIGFTGRDMLRCDVVNAVIAKGVETIAVTDSTKFGTVYPYPVAAGHNVSRIITDSDLSETFREMLWQKNIRFDVVQT